MAGGNPGHIYLKVIMGLTLDNDFENVTLIDVSGNLVEVHRDQLVAADHAFLLHGGLTSGSNLAQPMRVLADGTVVVSGNMSIVSPAVLPVSISNFQTIDTEAAETDIRFQTIAFPPSGSFSPSVFGKIVVGVVVFPGVEMTQTAYAEQTTNAQRSIRSSNAADTAAGTGARQVQITYFDQNLNGPFFETITMNGTTAVNTVNNNICFIQTIDVISTGTSRTNTGTISLFVGTGATGGTICAISPNENTTQILHHYIRPGWTAYLYSYSTSFDGENINQDAWIYLVKYNPLVATSPRTPISSGTIIAGAGSSSAMDDFGGVPLKVIGPARVHGMVVNNNSTRLIVSDLHFIERPTAV